MKIVASLCVRRIVEWHSVEIGSSNVRRITFVLRGPSTETISFGTRKSLGIVSVIAGTLLIGTLLDGLVVMNLNSDVQDIVKGLVLILAILLDRLLHPIDEETAKQGDTM